MLQPRVAKIISTVFHPLIVPTLGFFLLFNSNTYFSILLPPKVKSAIYLLVFFNTCFVPTMLALYLKYKNKIQSLEMDSTEERRLPFLATAFFYAFTYYLLKKIHVSPILYVFILGATLSLIITIFINYKWKISAHMVAWGGLTGAVLGIAFRLGADMKLLLSLLFIISGLVGYSRLRLEVHSPSQIYSGYILGLACQLFFLL